MAKKYVVNLTPEEREELEKFLASGKTGAREINHVHILLKADSSGDGAAWSDEKISEAFNVSLSTVQRVRQRFAEQGKEGAIKRKKASGHKQRRLDGSQEAHLIALACGPVPEGQKRWTIRLLANKIVELQIVESIAPETLRQTLKKTNLSLG